MTGLRRGGGTPLFQKGTGKGLVGVPGSHLAAVPTETVHAVTATLGLTIVRREFTDQPSALAWAYGMTELGWVVRRETREAL